VLGVSRPSLDPKSDYAFEECTDGWFMNTSNGSLHGNGKFGSNA
jgi:hypothetical protein